MAFTVPPGFFAGPSIPCPNVGCSGGLRAHPALDAYQCSRCTHLVSGIALMSLNPGVLSGVPSTAQMTVLMDQLNYEARQHAEIRRQEAYLQALERSFFAAVEALAEARGYVYQYQSGSAQAAVSHPGARYPAVNGLTEQKEEYLLGTASPKSDEPVKAWRAWRLVGRRKGPRKDEPILRSITYHSQWLPKMAFHARCNLAWTKGGQRPWQAKLEADGHHDTPVRNCSCGIYAKTSAAGASQWAASPRNSVMAYFMGHQAMEYATQIPVVGTVQLWGRVLLFTEGYRGEYGYPYHLFLPAHLSVAQKERWGDVEQLAKQLRSSYACDVEVVDYTPPAPPPLPGDGRNPTGMEIQP